MRHVLALVFTVFAACAADPTLPTRCTPNAVVACTCAGGGAGSQTCSSAGDGYSVCACPDAAAPADVADAGSPPADRPAGMDVVTAPDVVDAGPASDVVDVAAAPDVDPRQTPECRAVNQTCDGRRVNVQGGETDGGITYHCGRCGNTCPVGYGCLTCVCVRL